MIPYLRNRKKKKMDHQHAGLVPVYHQWMGCERFTSRRRAQRLRRDVALDKFRGNANDNQIISFRTFLLVFTTEGAQKATLRHIRRNSLISFVPRKHHLRPSLWVLTCRRNLSGRRDYPISPRRQNTPHFWPRLSSGSSEPFPFGELSLTGGARLIVHERQQKTFL